MTSNYTAFGSLFNQVQSGVKNVEIKDGVTPTTLVVTLNNGSTTDLEVGGAVSEITAASLAENLATFSYDSGNSFTLDLVNLFNPVNAVSIDGDGTYHSITFTRTDNFTFSADASMLKGLDGNDGPQGTPGLSINGASFADNSITFTSSDNSTFSLELSLTGGMDYTINHDIGLNIGILDVINDAIADYIGVLPALDEAGTEDINVDVFGAYSTPTNGKAIRLFVDGPALSVSTFKYVVMVAAGQTFEMRNGEAYTSIYNAANSRYVIIPGIINPKSKPEPPPAP